MTPPVNSNTIAVEEIKKGLLFALRETFESVMGIYLDKGGSLFETLAGIDADFASRPAAGSCATIAAHVEHIAFYMEVLHLYMQGQRPQKVNWDHIWETVSTVTPEAWAASQERLRTNYRTITDFVVSRETLDGENDVGGAMAIIAHTAYHLGEIRQMTCAR